MIFQCQTEDCTAIHSLKELKVAKFKIKDGEKVCDQAICPECEGYMVDITPFEGYGIPKKAKGDRSKNFYNRGRSQNVHK